VAAGPKNLTFAGAGARRSRAAARSDGRSALSPALLAALATLVLISSLAVVQAQRALPTIADGAPATSEGSSRLPGEARQRLLDSYGTLPLSFVPNVGQSDHRVRYFAQGNGFGAYLTPDEIALSFTRGTNGAALRLVPVGANADARLEAERRGTGTVNYFLGNKRYTSLPTYREIAYKDLWPGIDMVIRGRGGKLKYEFRVAPGADPSRIRLAYGGADAVSLGRAGELSVSTALGTLRDSRPHSYQQADGRRVAVDSRYLVNERAKTYGFALGRSYDSRRPLVIDPSLDYATYLGGASNEFGIEATVDSAGSVYVSGQATFSDFPTTMGAFDPSHNGGNDAFVTKLDASGSRLVYSTFLGGSRAEAGLGITVDANGFAYACGGSGSSDFPTTPGAFDTTHNGNEDGWVAKLDPTGSTLLYSSFIGGSSAAGDFGYAIAVGGAGNAYVTGGTGGQGFPTTDGAFDTTHNGGLDAFVAKLNATGSDLMYSTYVGGATKDVAAGIAVGGGGAAYLTGDTDSAGFPTTAGAFDTTYNGGLDAFITKLNATGTGLRYSTYLGRGADDFGKGIAFDKGARAYVAGWTASPQFPTTAGAFDRSQNGGQDAFVARLNRAGSALGYSTFLGGASDDQATGIGIDSADNAYATGMTASPDFPTAAGAFDTTHDGGFDAFLTKLNATGSAPLSYSTYLGGSGTDFARGIALDANGNAYLAGRTGSSDFPATAGAFDTDFNGGNLDAFVAKLAPG
jgi:Beta-propeller repeat